MARVLAINPGSTSTKVGLFEGDRLLFSKTIEHNAVELAQYPGHYEQAPFRRAAIVNALKEAGYEMEGIDAFSGRGGGLVSLVGGVYEINDVMYEHSKIGYSVKHPANLGVVLSRDFSNEFGGRAFTVNPPDVDEFEPVARVSGVAAIERQSKIHALNQKEVALRFAKEIGRPYEELNLIVAHIGGGISITAHRKGRMIDSNDIANGDGPMAPTRCGTLPVKQLMTLVSNGEAKGDWPSKTGGMVDHLGTSDVKEIQRIAAAGNHYAQLIFDAMIYQIGKSVGEMAAVLHGQVNAILLTGGISRSEELVTGLTEMVRFIAPIYTYPGEFELEALAYGAMRVLNGQEIVKEYTGIPVWAGLQALRGESGHK